MKVLDSGHHYLLDSLDGDEPQRLVFVKRMGEKYPGNTSAHPGTTIQEVLRACIDRLTYVDKQIPHTANGVTKLLLRMAIHTLECRAFERHGLSYEHLDIFDIEKLPVNSHGHVWKETSDDSRID